MARPHALTPKLLPLAADARRPRRRAAGAALVVLAAALAANLAYTGLGVGEGSATVDEIVNRWGQQLVMAAAVVLCALRCTPGSPERGAWTALTVALALCGLGNAYWNIALYDLEEPPFPSLADAGRLAFYPAAYVCIALHLRSTVRGMPPSTWLDGITAALAVAALGSSLVVAPILESTAGSGAEVIVNAINPIGDLVLASVVVGVIAFNGGRLGRSWLLLAIGFGIFAAADSVSLYRLAAGERIARALQQRFTVEGIELQIAASIGVALYPEHGHDAETLLQRADVAMYQAKARRSGTEFYARERDRHTRERLQLIGELRDAVAEGQLTLHYQPKLDLGRGRVTGVEALVRWPHPVHGLIPPGEFIPLAEQTGVIEPLTDLVVERALAQAAAWRVRGIDLTMAVNVSATNLLQDGWTAKVLAALAETGVRPDRFAIEITEEVLLTDPDRALLELAKLSMAGVRVALDDFGTGYASLSHLKKLPVDELKIDRSFVIDMARSQPDAAIVQTAVDLGRRLGIRVVAEGVEDAPTLRRLTEYGADVAQGYHIARPLPAAELDAWLAAGGFVFSADDEDVERAWAVDALDAVELDVGSRGRA